MNKLHYEPHSSSSNLPVSQNQVAISIDSKQDGLYSRIRSQLKQRREIGNPFVFKSVFLKQKNPKTLHTFRTRLDFDDYYKIVPRDIHNLSLTIASIKLLSTLDLTLYFNSENRYDKMIEELFYSFKGLVNLSSLRLFFYGTAVVTEKAAEHFGMSIHHLKHLEVLYLTFPGYWFSDKKMHCLFKSVKSLKALSTLHLDFSSYTSCETVTNKTLGSLSFSIRNLPSLLNLYMGFIGCSKIDSFGTEKLECILRNCKALINLTLRFSVNNLLFSISHATNALQNLQRLCLEFNRSIFDIPALQDLTISLKHLKSLRDLALDFFHIEAFKGDAMQNVAFGLHDTRSLRHLSLGFNLCEDIDDKAVQALSIGLASLEAISVLYLSFGHTKITSEGVQSLSNVVRSYKLLRNLALRFYECKEVEDKAANSIATCLVDLKSLKSLHLDFSRCKGLSDEGLENLISGLGLHTQLTSLCLTINKNPLLGNKTIEGLSTVLGSLKLLQHISLDLSGLNQLNNEGIGSLCFSLKDLKKLNALSIDCSDSVKITSKTMEDFFLTISNLKTLEKILFRCNGSDGIGQDTLKKVINCLKSLENLSRCMLCLKIENEKVKKEIAESVIMSRSAIKISFPNLYF